MLNLGKSRPALLGVDVSSAAVKVLELGRHGKGYRVEAFAVEPLPDGVMVDKVCQDTEAVGAALGRAVKRSGSRLKQCAMTVPSSAVITKTIQLSASLSDSELEGQVFVEADQYIPYTLEEVNLDFQVLGPNEKNPQMQDVLVVASRRENVESRIAIAEAAKLSVELVDVEAYAIEHASERLMEHIPDRENKPMVAIVDVGSSVTAVYVVSQTEGVVYTREQNFGGRMLTEEIMRRYNMSYQEAGSAKMSGDLPADYVSEVLEPFKQTMMDQIQRLLQYFYVTRPQDTIDHVLLGGGCAAIPGVDEMLEEVTSTPVSVANPFRGMALSRRINQQRFTNDAPALLTACGLALRGQTS
ncbi:MULTISPECIES: pilus assembly protein PilM [Thioalkalivibrio]|uniref:Fimbrial assembly protein n=1 Tax=Thioalkalivibrio halophilus TaxID=252474 RepID=A0A1V2ZWH2_9GAMM|nr:MULTISPECIES: pilus assembly protein PilM [Thioalkalivibrio]OOC09406.1 fimbrial assembly protein [Thioalkalivibrio halophilus]PYG04245.1 type IV pilus assembly protein PilM [Thioalkalivibrio sp. ALE21]